MRNIIIIALAILSLTACTREEINNTPQTSKEITFGNSFVAYTTKAAEIKESNFSGFNVWGYMDDDKTDVWAPIFEGNPVMKGADNGWIAYSKGDNPQVVHKYWIPRKDYYFAGIAPMNSSNISAAFEQTIEKIEGTISFTNLEGQQDLIYSSCYIPGTEVSTTYNEKVDLTFNHLLSKVRVSFVNEVDPYIDIEVSNVKIQAQKTSVYNVANETWSIDNSSEVGNYSYLDYSNLPLLTPTETGNTGTTESLFLIPTNKYTITFDVNLSMVDVNGDRKVLYTGTKSASVSATEISKITPDKTSLEKGTSYNFVVKVTPQRVVSDDTFEVDDIKTEDWNAFSFSSQISIASKLGGTITLTSDVVIPATIDVVDDLTINLGGKTITYTGTGALFNIKSERTVTNYTPYDKTTLTINGTNEEDFTSAIIANPAEGTDGDAWIATATEANCEIIINGGHHQTTKGVKVFNTEGGTIEINSGKFTAPYSEGSTLTMLGITTGQIMVSGGYFYEWDPANNNSGNDYLTEGLMSAKIDEHYFLVNPPKIKDIPEDTYEDPTSEFKDALTDPFVKEINLGTNISTAVDNYAGLEIYYDVTINGDGTKVVTSGGHNYKEYGFYVSGPCTATFNNLEIEGCGIWSNQANVSINNCKITYNESKLTGRNVFMFYNSTVSMTNCEVINAKKDKNHRFIYASNCTITIENGIFEFIDGTTYTVKNSLGCIAIYNSTLTIKGGTYCFNPLNTSLMTLDNSSLIIPDDYEVVEISTDKGTRWSVQKKNNS